MKRPATDRFVTGSVTIVLLLLGVCGLLFTHAYKIGDYIKSQMDIVVELVESASTQHVDEVRQLLLDDERVINTSVEYTSKEAGYAQMQAFYLEGIQLRDNPLPDVITLNVNPADYNSSVLAELKEQLKALDVVESVYYQSDVGAGVIRWVNRLGIVLLIFTVIVGLVAYLLLGNTLRLDLASEHQKIKTMQLVGAKDSFIERPFMRRAFRLAIKCSLIAGLIIVAVLIYLTTTSAAVGGLVSWVLVALVVAGLVVTSVLVLTYVTYSTIHSYLGKVST